ncbi:PREDICTED: uncharacterized protein LOC105448040 [Wasmannia auropunctata]|uniref:uncharacterized protein LOC105448040 n=1 Tax=Wasmannia auropunctata TaxID=64793 RepID=UPI0005EEA2CB|nr:PREDICTED: uncharacterized protein LOC105448040 [Wasmannia auropunctata]
MEMVNPVAVVYDYKKDVRLSIQLISWVLKPFGAWPKSDKMSHIERYAYKLVNVICTSLIAFVFIPSAIYLVLEEDDAYVKMKVAAPLNFNLMAVVKYFALIFRENDIRSGIEHIMSDWMNTRHYDDRTIMIRNAKFGQRLVMICTVFMYGGLAFYCIVLPLSSGKVTEDDGNLTYRPLAYPVANVLGDVRRSPINEIFFCLQALSDFIVHSITAGACSLAAVFAMHAYGRLEILMQWIEHLIDGREDFYDNVDDRLTTIVQQHVRILHMCFVEYFVIVEWENKEMTSYVTYVVLYIAVTFNIFILCYVGELVAEKYKKIGEISYMIDWHRLSGRKGLDLILIIAVSNQTSIKLTAGNFFELSLSTFCDVVKTSFGYLNMLRTLTT